MIVLIDAGNSRIKLGSIEAGSGRRECRSIAVGHADIAG
jgi:hypothetical protein